MKQVSSGITLIGLMGVGKTAVGKNLADKLRRPWIDTDTWITRQTGLSVSDIFTLYGEETFRSLEREHILSLLTASPARVLSLGGGAFSDGRVRAAVLETSFTIWLQASLETLADRLKSDTTPRPLLANQNPRQVLTRLLREREMFYAQAHLTVQTDACSVEKITDHILAHV